MGMTETVETISQWAEETFGTKGTVRSVTCRALKEAAELVMKLAHDEVDWPAVAEEAADVYIVLVRVASRMGWTNSQVWEWIAQEQGYIAPRGSGVKSARWHATHATKLMLGMVTTDPHHAVPMRHMFAETLARMAIVCGLAGFDLQEVVQTKMAVNRKRRWMVDDLGHGQHVPGT